MWTAVRLLTVCALGICGLFALRWGVPSHSHRPSPRAMQADATVLASPVSQTDEPLTADADEKKIVTVEKIHLATLDANDKAPPEAKIKVHHRLHFHHHRWHRRKHHH
jgi:hypothetical protein